MRVLLSTYDSRGGVEPLLALAVRLQSLGAEALVCAPVHHGGAGTTTTGTRAGVPQVVLPQGADQPYWASRVAGLGIGMAHDGQVPTTESLSAALAAALTPETHARARAVAGTIRTDGAAVAATLLLGAISREKPSVPASPDRS